jgi:hypothetical protein
MIAHSRSTSSARPKWQVGGFSIPEAVLALGIGTMSLGSALLLNAHELRLVKATRESGAATGTMEERVEQLRIANWRQMTSSAYFTGTIFATQSKSVAPLDNVRENITVSAWPDPTVCQPLEVLKAKNSAPQVISAGAGLTDQKLAKVDVTITWRTRDGRDRVRELSTVISNGGISRMNLPAMGAAAGSSGTESGTDSATQDSSTTSSADNPLDPTVTTATNNGRGNIGGKVGKK